MGGSGGTRSRMSPGSVVGCVVSALYVASALSVVCCECVVCSLLSALLSASCEETFRGCVMIGVSYKCVNRFETLAETEEEDCPITATDS